MTGLYGPPGGSGTVPTLTPGSIVFANASGVLAQDNSHLFWDSINGRLGIGNAGPATTLDVLGNMRIQGTGGLGLGGGTPAHYLDIQASDSIKSGVFVNHTNTAANASGSYPISVTDTILTTGLASGFTGVGSGVKHLLFYGDTTTPTPAVGTVGCFTGQIHVRNSAVQQNEYSILTGFLTMENNDNAFGNTTPGRAWGTDMNIHGPITTQPSALSGFHMVLTNRFNGNPADAMSGAYWALTGFGLGGGYSAPLAAATTFPVQVGYGVAGTSGSAFPGTGQGFVTAFQAGDSVATPGGKAGNWAVVNSRIGYGYTAMHYDTAGVWIDAPYTAATPPAIVVAQGTTPIIFGAAAQAHSSFFEVTGNAYLFGQTIQQSGADNQIPLISRGHTNAQSVDYFQVQNASTTKLFGVSKEANVSMGGHMLSTQLSGTTAAAAGANAGTTPPAPVLTTCSDMRGSITFGTGTTPAAGAQAAVTFGQAYAATPTVTVVAKNSATQALGLYVTGQGTGGFTLSTASAPAASQANTVYSFDYQVIG